MKRVLGIVIVLLLSVLMALFGARRISFNVDILKVLPSGLPNVEALRLYKEHFNQRRDLILAVKHPDASLLARQVDKLANDLVSNGIAAGVESKSALLNDGDALAETLAYLWLNSPPETSGGLADGLAADKVPGRLEAAMDKLANGGFSGADAMRDQYDPYGLLAHPFLKTFMQNAPQGDEFSSPDGTMRLLFLVPPRAHDGYKDDAAWVADINRFMGDWIKSAPEANGLEFGITGEVAYKAAIAALMEKDLRGSTITTGVFVALLFWIIQRRFGRLLYLLLCLGLIFTATLASGALLFREFSIMSIGFAAILMGLAGDYGVLASQYQSTFGGSAGALRRRIGPSIFWAAATTAAVFTALNLSAFPGIAQLGNLVAIGIIMAAAVTLFVFVPFIASRKDGPDTRTVEDKPAPWFLKYGGRATLVLLVIAAGVFARSGLPNIDYRIRQISETNIPPMKVFRDIQAHLPAWSEENFPVLVTGNSDAEIRENLARLEATIDKLTSEGKLAHATVPAALWPQPDYQKASMESISGLAARKDSLLKAAGDAGFSDEGLSLTKSVCESWSRFAEIVKNGGVAFPTSPAATAVLERFLARDKDSHVLAGSLHPAKLEEMRASDFEDLAPINQPGVFLAAWQTLPSSIKPLVRQDVIRVVLPTVGVLILMLLVIFRNPRDFALSILFLVFGGALLCAYMAAIGQPWTFQNMAAVPVLLGTGIDYAIHVILALRRYQGDLHRLWIGTGKALVFCGLTTAVGFGTLVTATDPGLASFGHIASAGISIALATSLLLLPAWWRIAHKSGTRPPADA